MVKILFKNIFMFAGDDADEEVFSDEDFEDDFDKPRQKSNLRYTESQVCITATGE